MRNGKFTVKERAYLASLQAVKNVSATRIKYEEWFRAECMCRYDAGESPVAIFREAGLDPELIGYKRIERCIARWKKHWQGVRHMTGTRLSESDHVLLAALRGNAASNEQPNAQQSTQQSAQPSAQHPGQQSAQPAQPARPQSLPQHMAQPALAAQCPSGARTRLADVANAQLAISERDLLIARQALRIRELERLVSKFVKR